MPLPLGYAYLRNAGAVVARQHRMVVLTSLFLSLSISEISGPKFPKKFLVVRTSLSLAVTLRKEGQVELVGETPN